LGAGVVGLSTANLLADRGYKVRVYSDKFASGITRDPSEGIWWPSAVSTGHSHQEKSSFKRILKQSYKHFEALADSSDPEYVGVTRKDLYLFDLESKHPHNAVDTFFGSGIYVAVTFDGGAHHKGISFESFQIDTNAYIKSLYEQALRKGVTFIQHAFQSENELLDLEENVIFNCLGKGSSKLFNDSNLSVVRHQTLTFLPSAGVDYMLRTYHNDGSIGTSLFALEDRVVLSGGYQYYDANSKIDHEQLTSTIHDAKAFFQAAIAP
jgi:D-amino-acid oxidase